MRHLWTLDTAYNFIAAEKIGWIGALIEDESILQRILGLSMHSKHPEKTLSRGVSSAPMPDIAVNVTAPPEVIKARAKARGDRAHINYDLPGFMDNALDLNVRLKELISKNTRVISLDSSLQCYHVSIRSISQEILDSLLPQPSLRRTHLA